uniref:EGF-like domain-containing protein n=1 Tax=Globodera rostochiensis TaxID=31243 RepID=A0A914GX96_GLORO
MQFYHLFFVALFPWAVVLCQNISFPSISGNDSSAIGGTSTDSSVPVSAIQPQQMAAAMANATQSSANGNASSLPKRNEEMQQNGGGDNGTTTGRTAEGIIAMASNSSNVNSSSSVGLGPSLNEVVVNNASASTAVGGGGTVTPLSAPTPLSMQVQLQQNMSGTVPQIPANNFGNAPLVFEAQTCSADDCNSRGTCIGTKSFPVCLCTGGSAGNRCQDAPCDSGVNCNSRGLCMGTLAAATCFCNIGYMGNQCQFKTVN